MESVSEFYDSTTVFVTGATGFLGKVLVEKLLRSCTTIKKLHILIRKKNGKPAQERFQAITDGQIFERIRQENPLLLEKLSYFEGNIEEPNLGISAADLKVITTTVNIVFHSAATVRFNDDLKEAGLLNALATKTLLELCLGMENLKSVVYVSTAYCNPGRKFVKEVIYETVNENTRAHFLNAVEHFSKRQLNSLAQFVKGPHPNTYTFTKSMAEQIASTYSEKLPISIVRPSIVTAAYSEPYPGWIDGIQGITGIIIEIARGTLTSILATSKYICDIIPVDIVVNTMILSAKETKSRPNLKIYNCTSGQLNPITWERLGNLTMKWSREYPSKYCILYPKFKYRENYQVHGFLTFLQHTIPAIALDVLMTFKNQKPIFYKLAKKFQNACWIGKFFSLNEWNFDTVNQRLLSVKVSHTLDAKDFPVNIREVNYEDYVLRYILGIRKFILKEETELHSSRKVFWLYWLHIFIRINFCLLVFYIWFKVLLK